MHFRAMHETLNINAAASCTDSCNRVKLDLAIATYRCTRNTESAHYVRNEAWLCGNRSGEMFVYEGASLQRN